MFYSSLSAESRVQSSFKSIKQRRTTKGNPCSQDITCHIDAVTVSRIADEREIEPHRRKIDYFRLLPEERISSILFPATSNTWEISTGGNPTKISEQVSRYIKRRYYFNQIVVARVYTHKFAGKQFSLPKLKTNFL